MTKEEFLEIMAVYFIQPGRKYRIHVGDAPRGMCISFTKQTWSNPPHPNARPAYLFSQAISFSPAFVEQTTAIVESQGHLLNGGGMHDIDHHFDYTAEERDFLLKHAFTLFYKRFQTFTYHGDSKPDFRGAALLAHTARYVTTSPRAENPFGREPQPDQGGLPEETGTSGPDTSQVGIPCFTNPYGLDLGRIQTGNWVVSGIHSVPEPVTHSSPAPIAGSISNGTQRIISDITEAIASFERNLEDLEF